MYQRFAFAGVIQPLDSGRCVDITVAGSVASNAADADASTMLHIEKHGVKCFAALENRNGPESCIEHLEVVDACLLCVCYHVQRYVPPHVFAPFLAERNVLVEIDTAVPLVDLERSLRHVGVCAAVNKHVDIGCNCIHHVGQPAVLTQEVIRYQQVEARHLLR